MIWWITGRSGAGKTTFAKEMEIVMREKGMTVVCLDGDVLRDGLCLDLKFSDADREENLRRACAVARIISASGIHVVCSFISPSEKGRSKAFEMLGSEPYEIVYVSTPVDVCEDRDPKGLYQKLREGVIPSLTGSGDYEPPESPDYTLTGQEDQKLRRELAESIVERKQSPRMEWPEDPDAEFYGEPCDADVYEGPADWGRKNDRFMRRMETVATILGYMLGAAIIAGIIFGLTKLMS